MDDVKQRVIDHYIDLSDSLWGTNYNPRKYDDVDWFLQTYRYRTLEQKLPNDLGTFETITPFALIKSNWLPPGRPGKNSTPVDVLAYCYIFQCYIVISFVIGVFSSVQELVTLEQMKIVDEKIKTQNENKTMGIILTVDRGFRILDSNEDEEQLAFTPTTNAPSSSLDLFETKRARLMRQYFPTELSQGIPDHWLA